MQKSPVMDKRHYPYSDDSSGSSVNDEIEMQENSSMKSHDRISSAATEKHLEKFLALQKRRVEICEKLTKYKGKRRNRTHRTATKVMTNEESNDMKKPSSNSSSITETRSNPSCSSSQVSVANESNTWSELKHFLTANNHLDNKVCDEKTKSGLEKKIDEAIAKRDFGAAVALSDQLADRDFGTKIAVAFDAKEFAKKRKREEEEKVAHNKKKLSWVFEHKQRWETKGNM